MAPDARAPGHADAGRDVGCVISACASDEFLLAWTLPQALEFAGRVVVSHAGAPGPGLADLKRRFAGAPVTFVSTPLDRVDELLDAAGLVDRRRYWPNRVRWEGLAALLGVRPPPRRVMFLDADEVPEGPRVRDFLARHARAEGQLAAWWYFRSARLRARGLDARGPVLVRAAGLTREAVVEAARGRAGLAAGAVVQTPGPMVHHYKWVRQGAEGLLAKARRADADALSGARRLTEAWARELRDFAPDRSVREHAGRRDLVFGMTYDIVDDQFGVHRGAKA